MMQIFTNFDCDGRTVFYAAGQEADAVPMIEIRANVTEEGWDTLAFIDSSWPAANATARRIVHCLATHAELLEALDYTRATLKLRHIDEATDQEVEEALRIAAAALARATDHGGQAHD
jgi:hypothetical protein